MRGPLDSATHSVAASLTILRTTFIRGSTPFLNKDIFPRFRNYENMEIACRHDLNFASSVGIPFWSFRIRGDPVPAKICHVTTSEQNSRNVRGRIFQSIGHRANTTRSEK
jgi:hypothetical protein